jgi:hypothetical protein
LLFFLDLIKLFFSFSFFLLGYEDYRTMFSVLSALWFSRARQITNLTFT